MDKLFCDLFLLENLVEIAVGVITLIFLLI